MLLFQGALSVLLLVGAGLFVRSLFKAQSVGLGLDTGRLLVVSALRGEAPPRPDFRAALRAVVDKMPGVERTTLAAGTLPFVSSWALRLQVPDLPERPVVDDGGPYVHAVEPGYFETVGTAIVEGRPFTAPIATARHGWRSSTARWRGCIGRAGRRSASVCRLARTTRLARPSSGSPRTRGVRKSSRATRSCTTCPLDQAPPDLRRGGRLIVRAATDDSRLLARIGETIRREALVLEPGLRYVTARPLDDVISPQLRAWRLGAGLFSAFGLLALTVAAVGLYSVVAFDVEGRRREIGVRAALGASSSMILRLVVGDGVRLAAGGVALGLALAWMLAPMLANLLYQVTPQDFTVFAGVAVALVGAAAVASVIPAFRAAHIDPSEALRDE